MVTVLIVENHQMVAQLTARLLTQTGEMLVTAIVGSAEAALEKLVQLEDGAGVDHLPDLVLIDLSLPGMSGLDLVAALQKAYPSLPCIILSGYRESAYIKRSLNAGARGYVVKDNLSTIIEAIQQVLDGEIYLSDDVRGPWPVE